MVPKRLAMVLMIGAGFVFVLVGPVIVQLLFHHTAGGLNDPRWQGLFYTHHPFFNKTSLFLTVLFALFTLYVRWRLHVSLWLEEWWLFCAALLLTGQLVYNIQVVLGWTVWPQHFAQYTNVGVSLVLVILLARAGSRFYPKLARTGGLLILVVLCMLVVKSVPQVQNSVPGLTKFQTYRPVFAWLQEHDAGGCVVLVNQDDSSAELQLDRFLPAYTNCDVYNSYHIYQGVPRERVFHNMLVWLWMRGVTPEELPQFLDTQGFFIRAYVFRDWADMFCCGSDAWVDSQLSAVDWKEWYDAEKIKIIAEYAAFLKRDIRTEISQYRLDYIVVDKSSHVHKDIAKLLKLTSLYDDTNYTIYSFSASK